MTTCTRLISVAVALSAGLFLAGCTTTVSRAPRQQPVVDFAVVESSTEKELTPAQLAALRATVLAYLREQGLSGGRTYYVKVEFPAANPADEPQWAIVRINNLSTQAYTVIAAYPGSDDYYPYDYGRSGYSHGGYTGFTRYGYHDPYHHDPGKYSPPRIHYDHPKPDQPAHKRNHPPGTHTRWDRHPRTDSDQPRRHHPPRAENPEQRGRNRSDDGHHNRYADKDHSTASGNTPPRPALDGPNSPPHAPPPANANSGTHREASSNASVQQPAANEKEK